MLDGIDADQASCDDDVTLSRFGGPVDRAGYRLNDFTLTNRCPAGRDNPSFRYGAFDLAGTFSGCPPSQTLSEPAADQPADNEPGDGQPPR